MSLLDTFFRAKRPPQGNAGVRGRQAAPAGRRHAPERADAPPRAPRQASVKAGAKPANGDDVDDWTRDEPERVGTEEGERDMETARVARQRGDDSRRRSTTTAVLKSSRTEAGRATSRVANAPIRTRPAQSVGEASTRARAANRQAARPTARRPTSSRAAAPVAYRKKGGIGTFRMLAIMVTCASVGSWLGLGLQTLVVKATGPTRNVYKESVTPVPAPVTAFTF